MRLQEDNMVLGKKLTNLDHSNMSIVYLPEGEELTVVLELAVTGSKMIKIVYTDGRDLYIIPFSLKLMENHFCLTNVILL